MKTLSERLKDATAPLHEKLDHLPLLSSLMTPALNAEIYGKILQRMHLCFSTAEKLIEQAPQQNLSAEWSYSPRRELLEQDLKNLGLAPLATSLNAGAINNAEAIGMMYVLHGSSLGGKFIARKIASMVPPNALHFYGASEGLQSGWAQYKTKLEESANELEAVQVIKGANLGFSLFIDSFAH